MSRFTELEHEIAAKSGKGGRKKIGNPAAVAAAIGRRKYGPKKFAQMAAKGRSNKGK